MKETFPLLSLDHSKYERSQFLMFCPVKEIGPSYRLGSTKVWDHPLDMDEGSIAEYNNNVEAFREWEYPMLKGTPLLC